MPHRLVLSLAVVMVVAACGSGDSQETTTTSLTPDTTTTTGAVTTTTAAESTATDEAPSTTTTSTETTTTTIPPEAQEPVDLLTFAQGLTFVSASGTNKSTGTILRMVDGDDVDLGLGTDDGGPVELVFQLPAPTRFDRFAIPSVSERAGNTTFFKNVVVSGSADGPDSGYEVLATFELETHGPNQTVTEAVPTFDGFVTWVKIELSDGILIEEGDEGKTTLRFTELIGNGEQEPQTFSEAFDGTWMFRLAERLDSGGQPLELRQTGATITGCVGRIAITGSVNGQIARATGVDTFDGGVSAFIFVADEDGEIQAVWSEDGAVFKAWIPLEMDDIPPTECEEPTPEPTFCGATVYINFDVNSATIRPESDQVLADLYDGLISEGATGVSIVGHTSSEGTEEYNLDLSQRRAQSVVDDLLGRGFDASLISATGVGETQLLISPDDDETSRELNRRVEIDCG